MRRAALRSALTVVANGEKLIMLDSIEMKEAKSAELAKAIKVLTGDKRALLVVPDKSEKSENLIKSGRNLADAKLLQANYLNIRDLLSFDKVIIPLASLDVIKAYLG